MKHEHLWVRLAEAKAVLEPVQSKYRVLFEDPREPDARYLDCTGSSTALALLV